jgi:hypothetical protein
MRNPHWFRLIPLLLITGCVSPEKPPPASDARDHRELTVFFGSLIDGKDYRSNLTGKMLDGTPRWPASKDAPPLAPRPAVRAALAELSRVVGEVKGWKLESIRLSRPADFAPFEDGWVYEVQFNGPPVPGPRKNVVTVAVLLNGRAVPLELSHPGK